MTVEVEPVAWAGAPAEPVVADRDRGRPSLVADIGRMRALLEATRDGEPSAPDLVSRGDEGDAEETALDRLGRLFGLSPFERDLVLLSASIELDGDVASVAASILGGTDPRPTFGLALSVLTGGHWDAIAPASPLRSWRLVELGPGPTLPSRTIRIDEGVLHHLTGIVAIDERLDGIAFVGSRAVPLAPAQLELAAELARTVVTGDSTVVQLDGDDVDARLDVACQVAAGLELVPLVIRPASLVSGPDLAGVVRLIDREVVLLGALPILDVDDDADGGIGALLLDLLEAPVIIATGGAGGRSRDRLVVRRSVGLPTPAEQRQLWRYWLGAPLPAEVEAAVEEIAQHFRLGARAVAGIARELAVAGRELADGDLVATLRRLARERARVRLDGLAHRIDPRAGWDDLVLPAGHLELLHDIARHVRHRTQVYERWGFAERGSRGLGVTALFAGESGTGKTLAAEVLAAELGLDLYRIDLSATVSKYIGETEKNMRRLFDAAEASGAVLLFDEADALFGRRGEVKDGHDRYANLEVAYLLQRMESYRGLAILTTNLRSHIDRAFLRRLRFVIQFPFPDREQRADIWRRVFPPSAPLDGIDPVELARMTVPGGSIRSIALSAAFAAAEDGTPVTVDHVMRAARVEYAKSERSLTDAESGGGR
jgi:vesicle-fusing ATPase